MAAITNTFTTATAIGNREDLTDIIANISPTKTPFYSALKKTKATSIKHEWQTVDLSAAANNKHPEGDDHVDSLAAAVATVRVDNYCQISKKTGIVSATQNAVSSAGRKKELAFQISLKAMELKRDIEKGLTSNTTYTASGTRQSRGLPGWLETNASVGGGSGAAPDWSANTAPTAGDARAFTESLLKENLKDIYTEGGDPSILMVGPALKQAVSTITGNATPQIDATGKKRVAAVDVYVSDFGTLKVVPNQFMPTDVAYALDMDYWALATLRPIVKEMHAKTGDADKFHIVTEYTLQAQQEKASGQIRDLSA